MNRVLKPLRPGASQVATGRRRYLSSAESRSISASIASIDAKLSLLDNRARVRHASSSELEVAYPQELQELERRVAVTLGKRDRQHIDRIRDEAPQSIQRSGPELFSAARESRLKRRLLPPPPQARAVNTDFVGHLSISLAERQQVNRARRLGSSCCASLQDVA
jgi:hypothetical protein